MAVAKVHAAQPSVLGGNIVTIEADLSRGLYSFSIVGLPGKAVEEARDRISSAIKNSGFKSPKSQNHKIQNLPMLKLIRVKFELLQIYQLLSFS